MGLVISSVSAIVPRNLEHWPDVSDSVSKEVTTANDCEYAIEHLDLPQGLSSWDQREIIAMIDKIMNNENIRLITNEARKHKQIADQIVDRIYNDSKQKRVK